MMKRMHMKTSMKTAGVMAALIVAAVAANRDLHGQVLGPAMVVAGHSKPVRVIYGRFTADVKLTSAYDWMVRGEVFVAAPARIVVADGARVVSEPGTQAALMIEEGAQLVIEGTGLVEAPVLTNVALVLHAAGGQPSEDDSAASAAPAPETGSSLSVAAPLTTATPTNTSRASQTTTAAASQTGSQSAPDAAVRSVVSRRALVLERPEGSVTEGSIATLGSRRRTGRALTTGSAIRRAGLPAAPAGTISALAGPSDEDVTGRQVVGPPNDVSGLDKPVRVIHGRFTSDLRLTSDTYWVLRGAVFIGAPGRIIIDPGTRIVGELATAGTLIIERGAQIIADGTAGQPIVFTSDQPVGGRARGDWGGLVINGFAPVNLAGGVGIGEGDTGIYGGNDPDDSSGILRYVRVEFAGIEFSPDNELNGIAFQGVGRGTIVDHIQVSFNKDDGIEMFGGTVDIKHAVLTGIGDDSIDWTFGWQGRAQFLVVQQRGDDADRGIEADNQANNNDLLPRSKPTIYNMTLVGDPDTTEGPESTQGMELREGTAGVLRNLIVMGFKQQAFRVSGTASAAQVAAGELSIRHAIAFQNGTNLHSTTNAIVAASGGTVNVVDPMLVRPYDHANPDFKPAPGSPALSLGFETPPSDGFFDASVTYRGALSANPAEDWTAGWTNYEQR
jgi:hypothetical protein